tara:strand:- start:352 stop:510 length:159 start_codon:yes stop_codon:yes gene_type:complete
MSDTTNTVKIKSSHPSQGEFLVIDEADFDKAKHELFAEKKQDSKPSKKQAKD